MKCFCQLHGENGSRTDEEKYWFVSAVVAYAHHARPSGSGFRDQPRPARLSHSFAVEHLNHEIRISIGGALSGPRDELARHQVPDPGADMHFAVDFIPCVHIEFLA